MYQNRVGRSKISQKNLTSYVNTPYTLDSRILFLKTSKNLLWPTVSFFLFERKSETSFADIIFQNNLKMDKHFELYKIPVKLKPPKYISVPQSSFILFLILLLHDYIVLINRKEYLMFHHSMFFC